MLRHTSLHLTLCLLFVLLLLLLPATANCQTADTTLTRLDEDNLNSLAAHTSKKIREAKLEEKEPKVLVIDFFRSSLGNSSRLGTKLADRFSESLTAYSKGLEILDRRILKDYLIQNWTTLEDLRSSEVCLEIGRQLGATGVIIGSLYEENGYMSFTIHLEGFGAVAKDEDGFSVTNESARLPLTGEMHAMLFQPGPNYARTAEVIPQEPGVARAGISGVTVPNCTYCPAPDYPYVARAAKFQGTVQLSIVVTAEGEATSIYVLKGAPFGLTAKAIEVTHRWRFKAGEKDGQPVSVRVETEYKFQVN